MSKQNKNVAGDEVRQAVEDQAFEELGGRATPPNRLDEILKRVADGPAEAAPSPFQAGKLWAAALLLLGLGTTIAASVLKSQGDDADKQQSYAAATPDGKPPITGAAPSVITCPLPADDGAADGDRAVSARALDQVASDQVASDQVASDQGKQGKSKKKQGQGKGEKKELPKGTDPADLAVLRSAEAMLEAEKNLRKMMKDGKIAGVDKVVPFDRLTGWKYTDGLKGMPKKVKKLDGKKVLMLGFMLPIDEVQNIKEFLLVESLWSCCYGQPPDINGIVRCVMPKGKTLDYQFEPLKMVGTFGVEATTMDEYCVDIYQLHVDYVEVLDTKKTAGKPATKEEIRKIEEQKKADRKRKGDKDC